VGPLRNRCEEDRGAAAVELALLLPLLLLFLVGVIDFGFAFNAQISLTHAGREGVRVEAIGTGDPVIAATNAYDAPDANNSFSAVVTTSCPNPTGTARMETRATYDFIVLPMTRNLSSEAVMRCNG
jgi:Flp pilus assembly protein TadG